MLRFYHIPTIYFSLLLFIYTLLLLYFYTFYVVTVLEEACQ